jgi:NTE family protein
LPELATKESIPVVMAARFYRTKKAPRLGLALSGGAARGIAHVGVLRAFAEHAIAIEAIAGTSAGALIGAALCAGMPLSEIEAISRTMRWRDLGRITLSRLGMQSNERLEEYLRARLPHTRFEEMPIPFAAVATDLNSGTAVIMRDSGDVPFAVRASCAIPGWYIPVTNEDGQQLVDGGLVANIPSAAARALGADLVIAVDVNSEGAKFLGAPRSAFGVFLQAMMVIQKKASEQQLQDADIVISPLTGHIRWDELSRAGELIDEGEKAALAVMPRLKHLIENFQAGNSVNGMPAL